MLIEVNIFNFLSTLLIIVIIWVIGRSLLVNEFVYIPRKKRHNWKSIKLLNRACFCSICEILLSSNGLYCDYCGICSDQTCIKKADKHFKCKEKLVKVDKPTVHLWVYGNLPLNCECFLCHQDIDYLAEPGLYGYRCCWCQLTTHTKCFNKIPIHEQCNFGNMKNFIIPPTSLVFTKSRRTSRLHLTSIKAPFGGAACGGDSDRWKPLIVIANTKSGSNTADEVLSKFRGLLHPIQVIELGSKGPQEAIKLAAKISPLPCQILVAGGDGTVGWILNTIFEMNILPIPEVCILPLGTGNDLSRVLGWGSEPPNVFDPCEYLNMMNNAKSVELDRWSVEIRKAPSRIPLNWHPSYRSLFIYNYFSIGVDAQVTLNFHKARESPFYMFSSRIMNKMLYLCFGTHQVVQPDCVGLEKDLEVYLDDTKIDLPNLQSVVFLNIDSWGAGVRLCEMSKTAENKINHSISDGKMEIFGIISSFHIAQLQVGLTKPIRLGQAQDIKIKINRVCPVQIDGEPWMQTPCEIKLKLLDNKAKMLKFSSH